MKRARTQHPVRVQGLVRYHTLLSTRTGAVVQGLVPCQTIPAHLVAAAQELLGYPATRNASAA